jgi:hypothetical protein
MEYARNLSLLIGAGEVLEVVEQPKVTLGVPENVYVPDFLVVPKIGCPYYVDVKGVETQVFKKNKMLWSRYGRLDLIVVKRKSTGKFTVTDHVKGGERGGSSPQHKETT